MRVPGASDRGRNTAGVFRDGPRASRGTALKQSREYARVVVAARRHNAEEKTTPVMAGNAFKVCLKHLSIEYAWSAGSAVVRLCKMIKTAYNALTSKKAYRINLCKPLFLWWAVQESNLRPAD